MENELSDIPIETNETPVPTKVDRRKETSRLNAQKARETKLAKQREQKALLQQIQGVESDSDSDSDSSVEYTFVPSSKKGRGTSQPIDIPPRPPVPGPTSYDNDQSALLQQMRAELDYLKLKQSVKPKPPKKNSKIIVVNPQPVQPIYHPQPVAVPRQLSIAEQREQAFADAVRKKILASGGRI